MAWKVKMIDLTTDDEEIFDEEFDSEEEAEDFVQEYRDGLAEGADILEEAGPGLDIGYTDTSEVDFEVFEE